MLGIQLLILGALLIVAPMIIGTLFRKVNSGCISLSFSWISGQMLLWAGFLIICVPMILLEKPFSWVCVLYNVYTVLLLVLAILYGWIMGKQKKNTASVGMKINMPGEKLEIALWTGFVIFLLVQLVLSVVLSYEEGDDAFYVAMSTITQESNVMYHQLPYTGEYTSLDARHGLAPFPVWIAYLGKMSGMAAVSVAQVVLSVTMIGLAYSIYYLVAKQLFGENRKQIAFFMILVEVLFMFGGYSLFTVENFLLVRASQGKAVIANIVLPFLFYLSMLLVKKLQNKEQIDIRLMLLLALSTAAGCLCSTQGTIIVSVMVAVMGLCMAVSYRNLKLLIGMACTCIVPVGMALLYFMVR